MKIKIYTILAWLLSIAMYSQKNLVINNTFDNNLEGWDVGIWGPEGDKPTAYFDIYDSGQDDKKSLKINVRRNSKDKNGDQIFLKQSGFKLKKGKKYQFSFWVKSKAYKDNIMFRIYSGKDTGSSKEWGAVFDQSFSFKGNGEWQEITYDFKAEPKHDLPVDYKNLAILFGFDKRKGIFFVDNVSLKKI